MRHPDHLSHERGSALVLTLMVTVLLFLMGAAILVTSETDSTIAANDQWAEGAFQAAEAAVQMSVAQLDIGNTTQVVNLTAIGGTYTFRSGGRDDTTPQPPELIRAVSAEGFALPGGTGYATSGYVFRIYRIEGTGTGPRNSEREVEVQVALGPSPQ
jgi:hypothetical protein